MTRSWSADSVQSNVRGASLSRYRVVTPQAQPSPNHPRDFAALGAIGRPRLWAETLSVAAAAFERQTASDLTSKTFAVQRQLARWAGTLLERDKPDVAVAAIRLSPSEADGRIQLDLVTAGPGRVYLYRKGEPVRLSPRDEPRAGLLREKPTVAQTSLAVGDLLLMGSVSAFSVRSMAQIASTIHESPDVPMTTLVHQLVDPAKRTGVGAAAVAIRIEGQPEGVR